VSRPTAMQRAVLSILRDQSDSLPIRSLTYDERRAAAPLLATGLIQTAVKVADDASALTAICALAQHGGRVVLTAKGAAALAALEDERRTVEMSDLYVPGETSADADRRRLDWLDDDLSRLIEVARLLRGNEKLHAVGCAPKLTLREVVDGLMLEDAMQSEGARDA